MDALKLIRLLKNCPIDAKVLTFDPDADKLSEVTGAVLDLDSNTVELQTDNPED